MAQMNRNVNLEEIDSDALFGIEALKNQTILQKIVFWGCVLLGVLANVLRNINNRVRNHFYGVFTCWCSVWM